jgi:hypothetical protein
MLTYNLPDTAIARKLISAGADVNAFDSEYNASMFCAAMISAAETKTNNADLLELLFAKGATYRDEDLVLVGKKTVSFALMVRFDPVVALFARVRYGFESQTMDKSHMPDDTKLGQAALELYNFAKASQEQFDAVCQVWSQLDPSFLRMVAEQIEEEARQKPGVKQIGSVLYNALYETATVYNTYIKNIAGYRSRFPECKEKATLEDAIILVDALKAASCDYQVGVDLQKVSEPTLSIPDAALNKLTEAVRKNLSLLNGNEESYELPIWKKQGNTLQIHCPTGKHALVLKHSLNNVFDPLFNAKDMFKLGANNDGYAVAIDVATITTLIEAIDLTPHPTSTRHAINNKLEQAFLELANPKSAKFKGR